MDEWSDAKEIAVIVSKILSKYFLWPSVFFLPGDEMRAILNGSRFDALDCEEMEDALIQISRSVGFEIPFSWLESVKFGDFITKLIAEIRRLELSKNEVPLAY